MAADLPRARKDPQMANEDQLAALEREKAGYVAAGKQDRADEVDAEIKHLQGGASVEAPVKETAVDETSETPED